jgi:hypothetical protein
MKKQVLKAATMFVGIIALAFISALAVSAQNPRNLVVNIPFDFTVKGKTLPAGEYIVSRTSTVDEMSLTMKRSDGEATAIVLTKPISSEEIQSESRLVFHRYGERYFLSQVWTSGDALGRELYKTRQEQSLEIELAKNNSRSETITLVASAR